MMHEKNQFYQALQYVASMDVFIFMGELPYYDNCTRKNSFLEFGNVKFMLQHSRSLGIFGMLLFK
jgi:hypothetical protein